MKRILLTLLLLSPLAFAEDKWWEQDLGIYASLYDSLLAATPEQRKASFYGEAENVKSLYCRSEIVFNGSNRNMNTCLSKAEQLFTKKLEVLFNLDLKKSKSKGIEVYGLQLNYIEPSVAALLILASMGARNHECIPENQGIKNKTNAIYIKTCEEKYPELIGANLWNADRYTRVKFLERRGLLVNNAAAKTIEVNELLNSSTYEVNNLIEYLEQEFIGVYCRSAIGIIEVDDIKCAKDAERIFLSDMGELAKQDINNFNLNYLDVKIVQALAIQFSTIAFEKCAPYNLRLDVYLDRMIQSEDEQNKIQESVMNCYTSVMNGYESAIKEANKILKREGEWKKEQKRKLELKIANATLEKEKAMMRLAAKRNREAQKESVGGWFGRLLVAVLVESADAYVKDKISKELDIKTGVYHSQDFTHCYYSSPTGIKKLKKKGGTSKTINYANIGTSKAAFKSRKTFPGMSTQTSIYKFSNSSVMKTQKTVIYDCPSRM